MRMRLNQAWTLAAALLASATASSPAFAADLPPPALPPVYDQAPLPPEDVFEGWWLGGTIGGATVNYDLAPAGGTAGTGGVLGGVVGGYTAADLRVDQLVAVALAMLIAVAREQRGEGPMGTGERMVT